MSFRKFDDLFKTATADAPFPYQTDFATAANLYEMVHAPTGAGKTATAILGWVWRYFESGTPTPRRLVYCLPMRVLVEQTRNEAIRWLHKLGRLTPPKDLDSTFDPEKIEHLRQYRPDLSRANPEQVSVVILMGGEAGEDWDLHPDKPAILIGTQDMLLSRALNRGYGMRRFRWPMHFALLNNDCLWVLDEIQLMGVGLATSAQMQAFRSKFGSLGPTKTVWMSATLLPSWLETVDFRKQVETLQTLFLSKADYAVRGLKERWQGKKPIEATKASSDEPDALAEIIKKKHFPGSLTLVVVNTVARSRELFDAIRKLTAPSAGKSRGKKPIQQNEPFDQAPDLKLIHSRFRPMERENWMKWLKDAPPPEGRIVISTQIVEAGVDLSARTLFTELAPWPSLVQRFGRCNRRGEFSTDTPAQIFWIDVSAASDKDAAPYSKHELDEARRRLKKLTDAGLKSLHELFEVLTEKERSTLFPYDPPHVIRRKDFIDLFDTTPDLAGNDIDVSRFIREGDELDVQVFWRADEPPRNELEPINARRISPVRWELCTVPVGAFREFLTKGKKTAYRWDSLDGKWIKADSDAVFPGQVFWIAIDQGGYSSELGWDPKAAWPETLQHCTPDQEIAAKTDEPEYDSDLLSQFGWQSIAEHTDEVVEELCALCGSLPLAAIVREAVEVAARWHDWGKSHKQFQMKITKRTPEWAERNDVAKAPDGCWGRHRTPESRRHFRHELASAIGVLKLLRDGKPPADWAKLPEHVQNLALYLVAAHHGKVRLSIRSMPNETKPTAPDVLFARGVWDGDLLPKTDVGAGVTAPAVKLDLSPMQLGRGQDGSPSWAERMLTLRDHPEFGPLRLAYLEAILRAADMRASQKAGERAKVNHA